MSYKVDELSHMIATVRTEAARLDAELALLPESSRGIYASTLNLYHVAMAPLDDPEHQATLLLDDDSLGLPFDMRIQLHALRDRWAGYLPQLLQTLQVTERAAGAACGAQLMQQLADFSRSTRTWQLQLPVTNPPPGNRFFAEMAVARAGRGSPTGLFFGRHW